MKIIYYRVYLASGLGKIFSIWNLPAFNLPFNVAAFAFLAAIKYTSYDSTPNAHFHIISGIALLENETFEQADLEWAKVMMSFLTTFITYATYIITTGITACWRISLKWVW